jgi:hypothetical protein
MDSTPARIVIELNRGADPIAGCVCSDGRREHAFTGWTGLFAALRAAASDEALEPRGSDPRPTGETRR